MLNFTKLFHAFFLLILFFCLGNMFTIQNSGRCKGYALKSLWPPATQLFLQTASVVAWPVHIHPSRCALCACRTVPSTHIWSPCKALQGSGGLFQLEMNNLVLKIVLTPIVITGHFGKQGLTVDWLSWCGSGVAHKEP